MKSNFPAHPTSFYAATANRSVKASELRGSRTADVCVVGGGFTGISAALHLAERGYDVVLLEAKRLGWGASGRNGGQVGSGQHRDTLEMEARYGRETARQLWDLAEEAKRLLRDRIGRHRIRCDYQPGNLLAITRSHYVRDVEAEAENLARHYDYHQLVMLNGNRMAEEVASPRYVGGCLDRGGGHLHPLNLVLGMADAARAAGARLFEASPVQRVDWHPQGAVLRTPGGEISARYVALCGNGYLGALVPAIRPTVMPILNHIVATEPIGEARARELIPSNACVHTTKFAVDYYRFSSDHRLLFGGGETYSPHPVPDIKGFVRKYMLDVFPQLQDTHVEFGWSGTLAITRNRMPDFGRTGTCGFYAQGFSGHGVALTQLAGQLLAEVIAGTAERFDVMANLPHRRFPGGNWLRRPLLVVGMLYYALKDRL